MMIIKSSICLMVFVQSFCPINERTIGSKGLCVCSMDKAYIYHFYCCCRRRCCCCFDVSLFEILIFLLSPFLHATKRSHANLPPFHWLLALNSFVIRSLVCHSFAYLKLIFISMLLVQWPFKCVYDAERNKMKNVFNVQTVEPKWTHTRTLTFICSVVYKHLICVMAGRINKKECTGCKWYRMDGWTSGWEQCTKKESKCEIENSHDLNTICFLFPRSVWHQVQVVCIVVELTKNWSTEKKRQFAFRKDNRMEESKHQVTNILSTRRTHIVKIVSDSIDQII